jgi:hypothetical protein
VSVSATPSDPLGYLVKDASFLPCDLRLSSLGRELPGTQRDLVLLGDDFVDETIGRREPVCLGESFQSLPPVRPSPTGAHIGWRGRRRGVPGATKSIASGQTTPSSRSMRQ